MMDPGVSSNFVSQHEALCLGLCIIVEDVRAVKVANQKALPMLGRTMEILKIGSWEGRYKLKVVAFDHFDIILGLEFMEIAKMIKAPHLKGILIRDEKTPWFVKALSTRDKGKFVQEYGSGLSLMKATFLSN